MALTVSWIDNARVAKQILVGKMHGARERALLDAGWKDANTARRAISAVNFIELLKRNHAAEYRALAGAPFSIVELLGRWHKFDAEGALRKALEWAKENYSVRDLADALGDARKSNSEATTKEDVAAAVREAVKMPLTAKLKSLLVGDLSAPVVNFKAPASPPVDYRHEWYVKDDGLKIRTIATLIVGPYQNKSLYAKRRFEWILRAFGTAWFFDRVFLIVPSLEISEQYISWIKVCESRARELPSNLRNPQVGVVFFRQAGFPRLTKEEDRVIADRSAELR
jgi:hypothetical protein